jgi:hypothetical protein
MSATGDYYLARAKECALEADRTKLPNVRERCLRSEAAWRAMAERVISTEVTREKHAAAKAAQAAEIAA